MAFGIKRDELVRWKQAVERGEIAFLTHYWVDERFPGCRTVTKAGCANLDKLIAWGTQHGLKKEWIDMRKDYPHFDLFGEHEVQIMQQEGLSAQLERFKPKKKA